MTEAVTIRAFDPKRDYPDFCALNFQTFMEAMPPDLPDGEEKFRTHYESMLKRYAPHDPDKGLVHVATTPNVLYAGHCWVGVQQDFFTGQPVAWIFDISVLPQLRGRGIGRQLLVDSMHRCRGLGFAVIGLQVAENNTKAMEFYRKAGFVVRASHMFRSL